MLAWIPFLEDIMSKKKEEKLKNYSPLRYPGGKSKLYPFVASVIKKVGDERRIYIEPFAGGAGIALSLLFNNDVDEIVINDYDKAIYSMWKAITTQTNRFLELLNSTEVTIEEWHRQKKIYEEQNSKYSLELGFATFFLNRVNRSGILNAGPIGGFQQDGDYKIDVRFNKDDLSKRIRKIAKYKSNIHVYNHDVRRFLESYLPRYIDHAFIYFDPPYFNKGKQLYKNFFSEKDHQEIHDLIDQLHCPWIVTYDNVEKIKSIYANHSCWIFDLVYGVANSGKTSEVLFISDENLLPDITDKTSAKLNIRKN